MTKSPTSQRGDRPRVLILGGGFAGVGAARSLKDADVDVVLIDQHDYHTFQPLLYQVATGLLEPVAVGHALRDLFQEQTNVAVHQTAVTAIDLERREVQFAKMAPLTYDYLVLALGATVNFFGTEGAPEHGFPMYTLADAIRLKEHVVRKWEAADLDPSLIDDGALNVVVVGGGPTGVETVGALAELYRSNFSKDYPEIPQEKARLILVEAGPTVFAMFKPNLRKYTEKALAQRDVEVRTGQSVTSIAPTRVTLKSGEVLDAHTLVWGAGLQGAPIVDALGVALERGKRVPVAPDLSVEGHPEVFAVGDIACITESNEVLPQLGSVALQSGEWAGDNIARRVKGDATTPFEYKDKGTMATIGRGAAVVQFRRGRTMKGKSASLAWGAVHLALLSTGEDRAKAVVDWTWAGFSHKRAGRIVVSEEASSTTRGD
jgi:NADH:quinone reductase (non-electrogenic)